MWIWYQSFHWKFPATLQEMLPEQHSVLLLITCSSQRSESFREPYPSRVSALSMRTSQGHPFFALLYWRSFLGDSHLPKDAIHRLNSCPCSGMGQRNWYPPVVHTPTGCHAYCWAIYVPLSRWAAQVEQFCTWKGWKNSSLESFVLQGSQQMALRGTFAWRFHYGSTAGWAAGDGWPESCPWEQKLYKAHGKEKHWETHSKSAQVGAVMYILSQLISQYWYWCLFNT